MSYSNNVKWATEKCKISIKRWKRQRNYINAPFGLWGGHLPMLKIFLCLWYSKKALSWRVYVSALFFWNPIPNQVTHHIDFMEKVTCYIFCISFCFQNKKCKQTDTVKPPTSSPQAGILYRDSEASRIRGQSPQKKCVL